MKSSISFLFLVLLASSAMHRQAMADDDERSQQTETPSRVKDGIITINEKTFTKAGLAVTPVTEKEGKTVIPVSAVIWWDGKAWVYAQKDTNSYVRHAIEITATLPDGFYEITDLPKGSILITRGAQLLLSEELGAGIKLVGDD